MAYERIAGTISFLINGTVYNAAGDFTYDLGAPKREMLIGPDRVHGYKETPKVPYIEGDLRDAKTVNVGTLTRLDNAEITLELANGKVVTLSGAAFCGDGTVTTADAVIKARFEGVSAKET